MKDYKGWTLYDKITVVLRDGKGYICDSSNPNQIETAKGWADPYYRRDKSETPKFTLKEFNNDGVTLTIKSSAGGSSQGGKLSFWTCIIKKDDIEFTTAINSNFLCSLIKNSTFVDGTCQRPVYLARCQGNVGALHEDMEEYKQAIKDMATKNALKTSKKTSKWQPGKHYYSVQTDDMLLGYIYEHFDFVYKGTSSWGSYNDRRWQIIKLDKPRKVAVLHSYHGEKTLKEVFEKYIYFEFRESKFPSRIESTDESIDTTNFKECMASFIEDRRRYMRERRNYLNEKYFAVSVNEEFEGFSPEDLKWLHDHYDCKGF